jgi:hypothetical protein
VAACSNVTFAVEAGGTAPLRYQWRFNATNLIANATNSSLTISNVQPADAGGYHVVVTNTLGSATSQVAVLTVAAADCDGDGMADDWETAHNLNPGDPGDAALDADNDGMSNLNEYRSGTDPQDPLSVLKVLLLDGGNGGALVRFTAMPDRGYSLLYQSNILSLPWLILTNLAPQPGTNLIEVLDPDAGASGIRYYRIVTPQQMLP